MPVEMWKEIEKVPGVLSADPFRKIYIDYRGRRILLLTLDIDRRMLYSPFKVVRNARGHGAPSPETGLHCGQRIACVTGTPQTRRFDGTPHA
jgi:hypothetical protein